MIDLLGHHIAEKAPDPTLPCDPSSSSMDPTRKLIPLYGSYGVLDDTRHQLLYGYTQIPGLGSRLAGLALFAPRFGRLTVKR